MLVAIGLWLRSNPKLALAIALILAALSYGLYERHQGASGERKAEAARVVKAQAKAAKVTTDLASSTRKAGDDASASQARIVYRTRTIIQRIPNEIPRSSDVRLSASWLRLHDASLGLPESTRSTQGASDQPGLYSADALGIIAQNNAECLKGWDAYQRVVSLYDQAHDAVNGFKP